MSPIFKHFDALGRRNNFMEFWEFVSSAIFLQPGQLDACTFPQSLHMHPSSTSITFVPVVNYLEFRFSSHLCHTVANSLLKPVVSSGGNRSTRRKPPLNPNSLATFSHAKTGIRAQTVVRDSAQSVAVPWNTWPSE